MRKLQVILRLQRCIRSQSCGGCKDKALAYVEIAKQELAIDNLNQAKDTLVIAQEAAYRSRIGCKKADALLEIGNLELIRDLLKIPRFPDSTWDSYEARVA